MVGTIFVVDLVVTNISIHKNLCLQSTGTCRHSYVYICMNVEITY